ncbi:MAG: PQQ-binding-like beta-propeller repeat protein [Desulfobacterales bacterium]|jgi:outer membrane protein assembly factor BamB
MTRDLRKVFWILSFAFMLGCAGAPTKWAQFHGDLSNRGFQEIDSGFALSAAWISEPYQITSSSPILGKDIEGKEILYVGTADAQLIAIDTSDGSEKWTRYLGDDGVTCIVSSPAVSDKRSIYVITNREIGNGRILSTLQKVDEFSNLRWSYMFPDNGFTTGSPKVIISGNQTFIFVYVLVGGPGELQGELFVLRDDEKQAELLDRKALNTCRHDSGGSNSEQRDLLDYLADSWNFISGFPIEVDARQAPLPGLFVDPTPAIDVSGQKMRIVIADNLCSVGAYEWDGVELSVLWRVAHDFGKHSSPALLPDGLMVFGNKDGQVFAYDATTGVKMWEYAAHEPIFATPAAAPEQFIFLVSKNHIQAVHSSDGTLIHDDMLPRKLKLLGQTHGSPAVTANRVYVSAAEILTVTYDFKARGHDTNFLGNGLSSVAVSSSGDVYAVGIDGTIRKYKGTD